MEAAGRYAFAPLPFYQPGRSVRLTGDGPSSWTDWIVVARTKAQLKWGTLPGGYVAGPGWNDKARMGGKPTLLMDALVADYSRPGYTVLDTHMGAGTTGVACARAGRKFIGCEVDRAAFDLACERIAAAYAQGSLLDLARPVPEQDQCRRDILATEIEMNKFQDQISKKISLREAIRHELRVEAYTDVPSKLTAIRDYYINFAADRTRVASMRAMAAEFAEKLEVIIKTI